MTGLIRYLLVLATLAIVAPVSAQIVFYEGQQFAGRSFIADRAVPDFRRFGFNDRASSAIVEAGRWEVCEQPRFGGRCAVLRRGRYPSLAAIGLGNRISSVQQVEDRAGRGDDRRPPAAGAAPLTFFEHPDFRGRSFTTTDDVVNFAGVGFNDRASSLIVDEGSWQVCDDAGYRGRCMVFAPGRYPSLIELGLDDRVSSARRASRVDRDVRDHRDQREHRVERDHRSERDQRGAVTFYEHEEFNGRWLAVDDATDDLARSGFADRASSVIVGSGRWQLCDDRGFRGRCVTLAPGRYPSLARLGLDDRVASLRQAGDDDRTNRPPQPPLPPAVPRERPYIAPNAVTFYEFPGYAGRSFTTAEPIPDLFRAGLQASSAEISGSSWEVCGDAPFAGRCMILRPGNYPTLGAMGLDDRISSVRPVDTGGR